MKISQAIKALESIKKKHGDVPVMWQSLSHCFAIEPEFKTLQHAVVVNP